jgi:DNA-binding beta-propeller fold protein YncE
VIFLTSRRQGTSVTENQPESSFGEALLVRTASAALLLLTVGARAQDIPAPYGPPENQWAKLDGGWGSTAGLERGPKGEIWAIDRCGANSCDGSGKNPIILLDPRTGRAIRGIGAGLFIFPHGLHVDAQGNVWVTDGAIAKDGSKGVQVIKLSPDGKVLQRLGVAGQRGNDEGHFNAPSDVTTAANGDIFVADGHAPIAGAIPANLNMRIMKFDRAGKFLKQWGKPGAGKSEFNNPHALAFDRAGRLFVADRGNNRIQIFTRDGAFVADWRQFGRPSGFYIAGDRLYAIDADSAPANHPGGWKKGVWIGSIAKALPDGFVPDEQAGEGVVITPDGNMLGAVNVAPRGITRYIRK